MRLGPASSSDDGRYLLNCSTRPWRRSWRLRTRQRLHSTRSQQLARSTTRPLLRAWSSGGRWRRGRRMRDVYVAGIGITTFTRLEFALSEIAAYASMMALKDAGVSEVDQVYVANMGGARLNHQTALASAVVDTLSLTPAGAASIENGPASGAAAIKAGFQAVASGMDDVVLVVGVERMREVNGLEATDFVATLTHPIAEYIYGVTLPAHAAMFTRLYMERYGVTERHLAMVGVKNQNAALNNVWAHLQQEITLEGILDSPEAMTNNPYVAEPLRFFDACPVSDGGAAIILVSKEKAEELGRPLIRISGVGQATDTHAVHERVEPTDLLAVRKAAKDAFEMAGLTPEDVDCLLYTSDAADDL